MIAGLKKLLPKSAFARGVTVLVGGTAGAQVLLVLAAPLLTRLYTPEDFGVLAVYAGLLALFSVIASLRYELAIPLPEEDLTAANLTFLSLIIVVVISAISAVLVFFAGSFLSNLLGVKALDSYLWLLPVGIFCSGSFQVLSKWAIRKKQFPRIAKTRILQTIATLGIQILGFKFGSLALVAGQTSGLGVGVSSLGRLAFKEHVFQKVSSAEVINALKRYKRFPLYDTWYGIFFTAGQQLPALMFAALFNPVVAGLYMLAQRVLSLPMSVIGGAVGSVFFSNAAEARHNGTLPALFKSLVEKMIMMASPVSMILLVMGPDLFSLAFGDEWRAAGEYARLMAVWLLFQFVTAPLTALFAVLEKQKHGSLFQAFMLCTRVASILIGAIMQSAEWAIGLFSLSSVLGYVLMILWMSHVLKVRSLFLFICLLKYLLISFLMFSPLVVASALSMDGWLYILSLVLCVGFLILYYGREVKVLF